MKDFSVIHFPFMGDDVGRYLEMAKQRWPGARAWLYTKPKHIVNKRWHLDFWTTPEITVYL